MDRNPPRGCWGPASPHSPLSPSRSPSSNSGWSRNGPPAEAHKYLCGGIAFPEQSRGLLQVDTARGS
eukprot:9771639-Heterocapsa_arctica.AAC.1